MRQMTDNDATMKLVQSESNEEVTIQRKEVNDAPKVLGCQIQANGSWKAEMDRWNSNALQFSMRVKKGRFDTLLKKVLNPSFIFKMCLY